MFPTMQPVATMSILAVVALESGVFVGFDGDVCATGAKALGVCQTATDADDVAPVTYLGIIPVVAGDTISAGDEVESDATGYAIPLDTGISNGYALEDAAAGDLVRVMLKV